MYIYSSKCIRFNVGYLMRCAMKPNFTFSSERIDGVASSCEVHGRNHWGVGGPDPQNLDGPPSFYVAC